MGERGSKTRFDVTAYHERSIAPIAEAFHFSRVPRLSVSDRHATPVAAAWDVSVPLEARVEQFGKSKGAPPLYVSGRERALRAALEASPPLLDSRAARSRGRRLFHSSRTAVAMVAGI